MDTKLAHDIGVSRPERSDPEESAWDEGTVRDGEALGFTELGERGGANFTVADMAREFGITLRAIRFYEDNGLLQPRWDASARAYGPRERLHLKMILKGKALGLSLSEIRDVLGAKDAEEEAQDAATSDFSAADLGAIAGQPGALDAMKLDLAMALRPEQIVAQIDHLERQRKALDDAILALREAHHRRVAGDRTRGLR